MDVILQTDYGSGQILGVNAPYDMDLSIGGTNDFQLSLGYEEWASIPEAREEWETVGGGIVIYVPGEEYGGYVQDIEGSTSTQKIYLRGLTWRGVLDKHIIKPPDGNAYTVTGKLEEIVEQLLAYATLSQYEVVGDGSTPTVTYTFGRYVTLLDGIEKMLAENGYKLAISYDQSQGRYEIYMGGVRYYASTAKVIVQCVPALNYGSEIEISQDAKMDFSNRDYRRGVNHLVCLGEGQLKNRVVVDLYADRNGNISQTQSLFGIDEIAETFENVNADQSMLIEQGTARLKTLLNYKKFTVEAKYIDNINLGIGDTITGKDYITGTVVTKPIKQKVVKIQNGIATVEYKI